MTQRKDKWLKEVNVVYSLQHWDGARRLYSNTLLDNKIKWLQYQIVRNSLKTNYIVSRLKSNVASSCSYCLEADELLSHLFWSCTVVRSLLNQIIFFLSSCDIHLTPIMMHHFQAQKIISCCYLNGMFGCKNLKLAD